MAFTTNIDRIEENLTRLGIPVSQAKEILLSGGEGFAVNYNHLDNATANTAAGQVRTALYSWINALGIKDYYKIQIKNKAIQVSRKISVAEGGFIPLVGVGNGVYAEGIGDPSQVMPTAEEQERADDLLRMLEESDEEEKEAIT